MPFAASDKRRFVVLEHRWNGVHWDFLVEDGETLRAWAIDEPIVRDRELPARELPAHRRVYLDYEGEISGGRGAVIRWDEGVCEIEAWTPEFVRLRCEGRQLVGAVELFGATSGGGGSPSTAVAWRFRFGK